MKSILRIPACFAALLAFVPPVFATAMAIYPALESGYDNAIRGAYQRAQQTQGAK